MGNPIDCLKKINGVKTDVQGNDPRTWMKSCAEKTLLSGGNGGDFKKCLIKKMESTSQHIQNPKDYADKLYNEIKGACSL